MNIYLVTLKFKPEPDHDPVNKKTGPCVVSDVCTDRTGAHHTTVTFGESAGKVTETFTAAGYHVTRVEEMGDVPGHG